MYMIVLKQKKPLKNNFMKETRAYKAGENAGFAIVEMMHLMYQNNTAKKFISGLMSVLLPEYEKRLPKIKK